MGNPHEDATAKGLLCNICKATTVTHTKRIYRNLLRKETSFVEVCCVSYFEQLQEKF